MSDTRAQALMRVKSVIGQLESMADPSSDWDKGNGGWTPQSRDTWLKEFREVQSRLQSGDSDFDYLGHHLVRVLDHDGVIGGPILKSAAELQGDLLTLSRQTGE
jgi:hypothetical protein